MTWLDEFATFASGNLVGDALDALNARGVSDEQAGEFQVGYLRGDIPKNVPENFHTWSHGGRRLVDVHCFPLTNLVGEIRGFQFRPTRREIAGAYTDFILSSGEPTLFGLKQAASHIWSTGRTILVEGVFDLFPVQRHCPDVFSTLSVHVTDALLWNLRRLCRQVVFGYDADSTGRKAVELFIKQHSTEPFLVSEIRYRPEKMPSGKCAKDPADLWELWGDVKFGEFIKHQL